MEKPCDSCLTATIVIIAALPGLTIGYVFGMEYTRNEHEVVVFPLASLLNILLTPLMLNYLGRYVAFIIISPLLHLSLLLPIFLSDYATLLAFRIISGLLASSCMTIAIVYVSEIVHQSYRGICLSIFHIFLQVSLHIRIVIDSVIPSKVRDEHICYGLIGLGVILSICAMIVFKESPHILANRKKFRKSKACLSSLRQANDMQIDNELQLIVYEVIGYNKYVHCCGLCSFQEFTERLLIALTMIFLQCFVLGGLPFYYIVSMAKQDARYAESTDMFFILCGILVIIGIVGELICIDLLGRRALIIGASLILFMVYVVGLLVTVLTVLEKFFDYLYAVLLGVYSLGGLSYMAMIMSGEIFPYALRASAVTYCVSFWFVCNLLGRLVHKQVYMHSSLYVYFIFCIIATLLFLLFLIFLMPETARKSLFRIQMDMDKYK